MKFKGFICFLTALLLSNTQLRAQYIISGKVFVAENKEALPFVSVIIKGTTIGAQTDFDGNFVINSPKPGDSLVAVYVGYKRLARPLNRNLNKQEVNFPMSTEGVALDEVVIKAGDNPAHRIIRNCVKTKKRTTKIN